MLKHMLIAIVAVSAFAQTVSANTPAPAAPPAPAAVAPEPPAPPAPVAPSTAPVPAPAAARREEEEKRKPSLVDRINAFKNGHAGTAALTGQITTLTRERDEARQQLGVITSERDDFRRQLTEVEAALGTQQNIVRATAAEIASTVGIPLDRLPAPQATGSELEDLQDKLKGEQNAHKRSEIMAQIIALRDKK